MTLFQALILGLVQGLTEFLPISSSGHLVLLPRLLGWNLAEDEFFIFSVLVQWGTLIAVLSYFWRELIIIARAMLASLAGGDKPSADARLGWMLVLATLPAIVAGWLIRDQVQSAFSSLSATGLFLIGTAGLLLLAERTGDRSRGIEEIGARGAFVVGLFQVLSLFPGVSRSGATISGGMTRKLRRRQAAHFSFLMAVPVMIAAGVLALFDLAEMSNRSSFLPPLLFGLLVSAFVGYFAIRWLMGYLATRSLYPFALYCTLIGLIALFAN